MNTYQITQEYSHDIVELWAVSEYYINQNLAATNDGSYTETHAIPELGLDKDAVEEIMETYWEEHGKLGPDYEAFEAELKASQIEDIREEHADEWVIVSDYYESETGSGFANTKYLQDSEEGETSQHGWYKATQIADLDSCYDDELHAWAAAKVN